MISAPEDGSAPSTYVVADLPGDNQGAVWMGGAAPDIDADGNVWVASGNAATGSTPDASDSVLELSPTMQLIDSFTPTTWKADNDTDADLASTAPVLLPNGTVFQVGKSRTAYVLNAAHLGGIGGQEAETAEFCDENPDGGSAEVDGTIYVPCGDGLRSVTPAPDTAPGGQLEDGVRRPQLAHLRRRDGLVRRRQHPLRARTRPTGKRSTAFPSTEPVTHFPSPAAADGLVVAPAADQLFAFDGPAGLPGPPTPEPARPGYWLTASDGGIFSFGASTFYGSTGNLHLNEPVVGMAPTPDRRGYWLVASDGGVFAFGDAGFYGSTGALHLNAAGGGHGTDTGRPRLLAGGFGRRGVRLRRRRLRGLDRRARTSTPGGGHRRRARRRTATGWWPRTAGSSPSDRRPSPGRPATWPWPVPSWAWPPRLARGVGYWLVASDGGIFSFGGAGFYGSTGGEGLPSPVVGMAPTTDGHGYWLAAADGGVFALGDALFSGALAGLPLNSPVVGLSTGPEPT